MGILKPRREGESLLFRLPVTYTAWDVSKNRNIKNEVEVQAINWNMYLWRSAVVTLYVIRIIIQKFYVLPTQCVYVFCVDLRINSGNLLHSIDWFLGVFAKLRNTTQSANPHATTRLPLDWFLSGTFIGWIGRKCLALCVKTWARWMLLAGTYCNSWLPSLISVTTLNLRLVSLQKLFKENVSICKCVKTTNCDDPRCCSNFLYRTRTVSIAVADYKTGRK